MIDAFYVAATGMIAEQSQLNIISNNLANVDTPAYKKSRVAFEDLIYKNSSAVSDLNAYHGNARIGMGSNVADIYKIFETGDLKQTSSPLNVAIRGSGFLEVTLPNGDYAYTRNGALKISNEGYLQTINGYNLSNNIVIPPDAESIAIREDGAVEAIVDNEVVQLGEIQMAAFLDPSGLEAQGNGLYMATDNSGDVVYAKPGENGIGTLQQGYVEASNVDLVEELVNLMVAQKAFGSNSQVLRASDEMMRIINNLRQS